MKNIIIQSKNMIMTLVLIMLKQNGYIQEI